MVLVAVAVRVLALAFAVLLAPLASADWLQRTGSADRTGAAESGPEWGDIALRIQLPGPLARPGNVVLHDGHGYFVTSSEVTERMPSKEREIRGRSPDGVWRVNLTSGEIEPFPTAAKPRNLASEGQHLFVNHEMGITAYNFQDGREQWTWPPAGAAAVEGRIRYCGDMAVADAALYAVCMEVQIARQPGNETSHGLFGWPFAVKLDARTGEQSWQWVSGDRTSSGRAEAAPPGSAYQVSVVADTVFILGERILDDAGYLEWFVAALDPASGEPRFPEFRTTTDHKGLHWHLYDEFPLRPTVPIGSAKGAFLKLETELLAIQPTTGTVRWREPLVGWDPDAESDTGSPISMVGDTLFVPTLTALRSFNEQGAASGRYFQLEDGSGREVWSSASVVAGGRYYGVSGVRERAPPALEVQGIRPTSLVGFDNVDRITEGILYALDAQTLEPLWEFRPGPSHPLYFGLEGWVHFAYLGVLEGNLVLAMHDGNVTVFGRTAGSLGMASLPDAYPAPHATVTLDLAGTTPGIGGEATMFRAEWGDGNVTEWQANPVLEHAYPIIGRYTARIHVGNDAGQTSSILVVFHVGGQDPALVVPHSTPTLAPFVAFTKDEIQNFGLMGAAGFLVVAGAAVVWRVRGDPFQRELRAINRTYSLGKSNPTKCEAELQQHKVRARNRLLEGKIGSPVYTLLVSHLDELTRGLYTSTAFDAGDRFRVERELGRGATSRALLAHDTRLDRKVVLKQPLVPWLMEKTGREQYLREARALAKVRHPNVLTVHEVLLEKESPVLVLEFAEGGSLADRLKERRTLATPEALKVTLDVLAGLERLHSAGLVHRDLKPANILLDSAGVAKISDLGIALPKGHDMTVGVATGSPAYMSPEQARGEAVDARADLYGVAAILYECLTGRRYVELTDEAGDRLVEAIETARPHFDAKIPAPLAVVLARGLSKNRERRFASAAQMSRAILDAHAPIPKGVTYGRMK